MPALFDRRFAAITQLQEFIPVDEKQKLAAAIYARLVAQLFQNSRAAPDLMMTAADTALMAADIFMEKSK